MTTTYQLGPNCSQAIWYQEVESPAHPMADIAIADFLDAIPATAFANGATPTAQFTAGPWESFDAFKARINAALIAAGTRGVAISLYWRSGFFGRNLAGTLLPPG